MIHDNTTANRVKVILTGMTKCLRYPFASARSDLDRRDSSRPQQSVLRPDSGGYNEAFIVSHWASFGPRY
jgi:hypothetical protein